MKLAMSLILILSAGFLHAQDEKIPVAMFPFVSLSPEYKGRASQIQEMVLEMLQAKSNIEVIDRSKDSLLMKELDNQIREQSVAAQGLVQQGKVLGAKNMIVGTVSNIVFEQSKGSFYNTQTKQNSETVMYSADVSFSLQLSDVESGKILSTKAFNSKDLRSGIAFFSKNSRFSALKEDAIMNAISVTKKAVAAWLNQTYPPLIQIVKIEDRNKKGYPQTVLVTGIDGSIQKGAQLTVNEIEMIDVGQGKPPIQRRVKIADLKVQDLQGDITVCRVTSGENILEAKWNAKTKMEFTLR